MNYSRDELDAIGFGGLGANVAIHKTVEIFSPEHIYIGDNVRIDCFCLLSACDYGIFIGNNVHLAASVFIFGGGGKVTLDNFCGLSSRVSVYTSSDDYSEGYLTNPTIPGKYKKVTNGGVTFKKHAIVGSGSVIMPKVDIGVGASIGALSFVNKNIADFLIVSGNPLRMIGRRNEKILEMEEMYLNEIEQG